VYAGDRGGFAGGLSTTKGGGMAMGS
jgi:hypothetical protein